jgi:pimeloyl-ACP methyl ester carboxylesterase
LKALYMPEWNAYLRYLDLPGTEPAVVFLPGSYLAGSAAFLPTAVEPGLSNRRRLIVDLLGGGYSDKPIDFSYSLEDHAITVAALLDDLELSGCAVVGHSFGGAVAIELATQRSDLVERLLLAEANLDPVGGGFTRFVTSYSETDFVASGFTELLSNLEKEARGGDPVSPIALGIFGTAAPYALHRSSVSVASGTEPVMRTLLYRLSIPRLYIFGERSLPDEDYEVLPSRGVAVAVVQEAGHAMTADNPVAFAEVIENFLLSSTELTSE